MQTKPTKLYDGKNVMLQSTNWNLSCVQVPGESLLVLLLPKTSISPRLHHKSQVFRMNEKITVLALCASQTSDQR